MSNDDCLLLPAHHGAPQLSSSSSSTLSSYQRIYLKCFICSKREYIDARLTTSDALHLHWLEHGNDLSLNIYDSIIDSMLTRVVEFFHFPKQHTLEGKIQTVFILNSEEVRQSRPLPASDDACIILDWTWQREREKEYITGRDIRSGELSEVCSGIEGSSIGFVRASDEHRGTQMDVPTYKCPYLFVLPRCLDEWDILFDRNR